VSKRDEAYQKIANVFGPRPDFTEVDKQMLMEVFDLAVEAACEEMERRQKPQAMVFSSPISAAPVFQGCEHDFVEEAMAPTSSVLNRRWRCRKCLEIRYTAT
jgi:hypothetical protein